MDLVFHTHAHPFKRSQGAMQTVKKDLINSPTVGMPDILKDCFP